MADVTVTVGVHFPRDTTPDTDIMSMSDGRWMAAVGPDCTLFGSADQLRAVALSILDQVPAAKAPVAAPAEAMSTVDQGVAR